MKSLPAFLLLTLIGACRSTSSALGPDDVAAIREHDALFSRQFVPRLERGEHAAIVAGYYAPDAVFMPPNAPAAQGHAAIEATLRALPPIREFELRTKEVTGTGDLAYARGTYRLVFAPPGQAPVPDSGKFLEVFRRQPDGTWRVTRDIFNSDLPPAGGAGK